MTQLEATNRICRVLSEHGIEDLERLESFVLRLDSLERAELMLDLEEEFHIEIPDDDFPQLGCIARAAEYVVRHVA